MITIKKEQIEKYNNLKGGIYAIKKTKIISG
jgi:hypothetical protein